jgi:uncharacterized membrane protein YvbJ
VTSISHSQKKIGQKIHKEISKLGNAIDQKDFTAMYRTFHSTSTRYTFFSQKSMELSPK